MDDVAAMESALLDDDRRHRALAFVKVSLDDGAGRRGLGIGLELLHLGDDKQHLKKFVDVEPLFGRHIDHYRIAAPLFGDEAVIGKLLAHPLRLRLRLVHLVDGDDDGNARRLSVVERLYRLRFDPVIGGHH
ncbi:hypothetical protein SDC9_178921 [bioreactor metagenome]|uniref:Uncharacterized protein n=1 Tax=bioreactor metagenome TaxID=1076179 RepID=A0A645GXJ3_9ZZZZ